MKVFRIVAKITIYIFLISCIVPIILIGIYAFSDKWIFPNVIPSSFTLDNLKYIYEAEGVKAIVTSIIIGIMTGLISVIIGLPTAKALAHYNFKYRNIIMIFVLLPLAVPAFTIISVTHTNMIKLGLDGTLIGVALLHAFFAIPYVVRILFDYMKLAGVLYEKTAQSLGANSIQVLKYITLPIIKHGLLISFFLSFTISISQYITTLMIGGGKIVTLSTLLVPYIAYGNYEVASVYSLVIVLVSMLCYIIIFNTQKIIEKVIWG